MKIPERQTQIDALTRKYLTKPEAEENGRHSYTAPSKGDEEIIEKARAERNGKFDRLWRGDTSDYDHDASRADDGFVHKLWSYTQDEEQVERIHAMSGLNRSKSTRRADYLRRSIVRARKDVTWFYEWPEDRNRNDHNHANSTNSTNSTNSANSANPEPMTAAKLLEMEMQPVRWIVPGILPEGLTLLVGKPKKGKSWMAMGLVEAVAAGGVAFGTKRVEKGATLYLALEDNPRRLQKRLKKVLDGRAAPADMYVETTWQRLEEGGAGALDGWLSAHPEARLVVIDTLAKIRKPARGKNVYHEDYSALESLLPIAARHGVAIVVVHHLRKGEASDPQDEISGSTGLAGGVDGFLILRRTPGSKGPTLYVDGRDIEEPAEYALHWNINTATWTIEGTAEEVHLSRERQDILLVLNRTVEPMTPKEVADLLPGAKHNNVKYLMWQMAQDEQLVKVGTGKYEPANRTNPSTNRETPHRNAEKSPSVSRVSGVSNDMPASFDLEPGETATVEQLQEIRRMVSKGWAEHIARKQVLGKAWVPE